MKKLVLAVLISAGIVSALSSTHSADAFFGVSFDVGPRAGWYWDDWDYPYYWNRPYWGGWWGRRYYHRPYWRGGWHGGWRGRGYGYRHGHRHYRRK